MYLGRSMLNDISRAWRPSQLSIKGPIASQVYNILTGADCQRVLNSIASIIMYSMSHYGRNVIVVILRCQYEATVKVTFAFVQNRDQNLRVLCSFNILRYLLPLVSLTFGIVT